MFREVLFSSIPEGKVPGLFYEPDLQYSSVAGYPEFSGSCTKAPRLADMKEP